MVEQAEAMEIMKKRSSPGDNEGNSVRRRSGVYFPVEQIGFRPVITVIANIDEIAL